VTQLGTTSLEKQRRVERYDVDADRPHGEKWVAMSNALARAGQGLSLSEKRLIAMAASKLDSRRVHPDPFKMPVTHITAMDYAEAFDVNLDTAYDQLQMAGKQLYERSITWTDPPKTKRSTEGTRHVMRWIGQASYHKKEGWIELHWWLPVLPHLLGLKEKFTTYQLKQASALRSLYSWRLLEMLQSWKDKGRFEVSIDEFCTAMDATPKQRTNFNNIKRRMIEPAIKELIEKDGWLIQWEPVKTGRKVGSLRFTFMKNPQGSLL